MRKAALLFALCALLALAGCQGKAPVNLSARNENGTPAVNLPAKNPQEKQAEAKPEEAETETPPAAYDEAKPGEAETETPPAPPAEAKPGETKTEAPPAPAEDIIEIKEKMFIAQTNDVYFNTPDYLGKTFKYEGIFCVYEVPETGATYYSVIRYGPGCCGVDANAGFEVVWDKEYPKQDDWVEAIGVLEAYEEDGLTYLRLALTSLTVLPTRGAEYVSQ